MTNSSTLFYGLVFVLLTTVSFGQNTKPNILLVISDDMGVDVLNGYHFEGLFPSTPTLDCML